MISFRSFISHTGGQPRKFWKSADLLLVLQPLEITDNRLPIDLIQQALKAHHNEFGGNYKDNLFGFLDSRTDWANHKTNIDW